MERQSHSFIAGLFVILLGLGSIAGALWLGPDKGPERLPIDLLRLTGARLEGRRARALPRVDVGRVASISFDPSGSARSVYASRRSRGFDFPIHVRQIALSGHHGVRSSIGR